MSGSGPFWTWIVISNLGVVAGKGELKTLLAPFLLPPLSCLALREIPCPEILGSHLPFPQLPRVGWLQDSEPPNTLPSFFSSVVCKQEAPKLHFLNYFPPSLPSFKAIEEKF